MERQDAIREIKSSYAHILRPAKKRNTYICPLCGNGTGSEGDGITHNKKAADPSTSFKCFKCGFAGDIIDLYMQQYSTDFNAAVSSLASELNIIIDPYKPDHSEPIRSAAPAPQIEADPVDFTAYYKECRAHIDDPAAAAYLQQRGIGSETAELYAIGYDPKKQRLIIPASRGFYLARDITGSAKLRYENPKGAAIDLFNAKALYNDDKAPVYITEGVFDALAIIEAGAHAIALNSTSNKDKLCKILAEKKSSCTLIIALDNDEAGIKTQNSLIEQLKALDVTIIAADVNKLYLGKKDAAEALAAEPIEFKAKIQAQAAMTSKPDNIRAFILSAMDKKILEYKQGENIKTGFKNLDSKAGSIHAGLYVIGAVSSLGKTTFMHQIADQLAAQGQHVLFFSLEQSTLELVSKSLSRRTAQIDYDNALTSLQIRYGKQDPLLDRAKIAYIADVDDRLSIIEGNFGCSISFIREKIQQYIEQNNCKPVVILDYLQILPPEQLHNGRSITDPKAAIDYNITELKKISRSLSVPVFVISSINRSNYLNTIDFSSFKESGAIEYTADVVWGLQLACISENEIFKSESKLNEKRELIRKEKSKLPRDIQLVCLKNRYGISDYTVKFKYYPNYDLFKPADEWQPIKEDHSPFRRPAPITI